MVDHSRLLNLEWSEGEAPLSLYPGFDLLSVEDACPAVGEDQVIMTEWWGVRHCTTG